MALSQDFEARRRQRLKEQHKKRERMRKIQRLVLILAVAVIAIILVVNVVRCATKPDDEAGANTATQIPYETAEPEESAFAPSVPNPKKGKNNYLDIIKESGQNKHVYLTFDDGPSDSVTPEILDVLRRYGVKATFFMTGDDIQNNPYLCTRAMEEGHLVLPLSKSGDVNILYADKTSFMDEVEETYKLIVDNSPSTTKPVKIYRFLGGSDENSSYGQDKREYKDVLAENGYYYCDWNTTIGDTDSSRTPEQLVNYFTQNIPQLNNLIIQMHNTDKNSATAKALGDIIEKLSEDGFTFSRLDEIDFVNEIPEDDDDDENTNADNTNSSTQAPATDKPSESTSKPKGSATPKATSKPKSSATPKATSTPANRPTVTESPKTATLPPSNEIEAE